ncbi:hypothetical protein DXG01_008514 [Tephrocybe rancida]|nr:hypothetical protein DXG01_008514 [Tephrocybe rancida]
MAGNKGKQWKKEIKVGDVFIDDGRESDLIIPIMGPTGSGKSTFINTLLGGVYARVGHDLQSETQDIQHYRLPPPCHHIVVVDTPGFDDTYTTDREILRRIAVWMADSYSSDMKVAGLIYLHEITKKRLTGTVVKNFDMFTKICGPGAVSNIVLVTTKWGSDQKSAVQGQREAEIRNNHWKDLLSDGSKMRRFYNTQGSAQTIVNEILALRALDATRIQSELVDIDKILAETDAGRTLRYALKELLARQKEASETLEREGGDEARNVVIDNDVKIRGILCEIDALKIPFKRRALRFFGLVKG